MAVTYQVYEWMNMKREVNAQLRSTMPFPVTE